MLRHASLLLVAALFAIAAAPSAPAPLAPELIGGPWLGSPPLTLAGLRGKVVLVEFWTFACGNCQNVEPHVRRWHERYASEGLVVIGVHSPELAFERDVDRLRRYLEEHRVTWPVLVDAEFENWRAYRNRYWPAFYLIDKRGRVRHHRVGEGGYAETAARIEELLAE